MAVANEQQQQQQQQLLNIEIFEEKEGDELINLRTRLVPASQYRSFPAGRGQPAKISAARFSISPLSRLLVMSLTITHIVT